MARMPKKVTSRRVQACWISLNGQRSQIVSTSHTTTVAHMIQATLKFPLTVPAKSSQ